MLIHVNLVFPLCLCLLLYMVILVPWHINIKLLAK
jgi:hypothetical protein